MKRATMILGGVALLVGLTGCETTRYEYVDGRTPAQRADACVASIENTDKAPQVMTYDSETRTEVHVNQDGKTVSMTAQNKPDATSMGARGTVGGGRPDTCTDASVSRSRYYDDHKESKGRSGKDLSKY